MASHSHQPAETELEELDLNDPMVASQKSELHAPQKRAQVDVDAPSIVVSPAAEQAPEHTRRRKRRSQERTVVIRDRRQLDQLRHELARRDQSRRAATRRMWFVWGGAGLLAFAVGGLIALALDGDDVEAKAAVGPAAGPEPATAAAEGKRAATPERRSRSGTTESAQAAPTGAADRAGSGAASTPASSPTSVPREERSVQTITLDELPVE